MLRCGGFFFASSATVNNSSGAFRSPALAPLQPSAKNRTSACLRQSRKPISLQALLRSQSPRTSLRECFGAPFIERSYSQRTFVVFKKEKFQKKLDKQKNLTNKRNLLYCWLHRGRTTPFWYSRAGAPLLSLLATDFEIPSQNPAAAAMELRSLFSRASATAQKTNEKRLSFFIALCNLQASGEPQIGEE